MLKICPDHYCVADFELSIARYRNKINKQNASVASLVSTYRKTRLYPP